VPPIGPGSCHRGGPAGCQVTAPGRAKPTAGEGAAGPGNRVDGQRNRSRPAVRGRAFSYPWPFGLPGIPGVHGRMTDSVSPFAASRRVCAGQRRVTRVGRGRSVNRRLSLRWFEPNTCHHLRRRPPGCGNASGGPGLFLSRRVSWCVTMRRYCRGVHGRIADGVRTGRAVGDTVGFPRTATDGAWQTGLVPAQVQCRRHGLPGGRLCPGWAGAAAAGGRAVRQTVASAAPGRERVARALARVLFHSGSHGT
jgi:hypothetical protein